MTWNMDHFTKVLSPAKAHGLRKGLGGVYILPRSTKFQEGHGKERQKSYVFQPKNTCQNQYMYAILQKNPLRVHSTFLAVESLQYF